MCATFCSTCDEGLLAVGHQPPGYPLGQLAFGRTAEDA